MAVQKVILFCIVFSGCTLRGWTEEYDKLHLSLEVTADNRRYFDSDYDWSSGFTLQGSANFDKYNTAGLLLGLHQIKLKDGSQAAAMVTDPGVVQWGVFGRHSFTPVYAVFQPYVGADVRFSWMGWSYRTPVFVDSHLIHYDGIVTTELNVSAGVRIHLVYVDLFGEIECGGMGVFSPTDQGVRNTFLPSAGYIGVKLGAAITF